MFEKKEPFQQDERLKYANELIALKAHSGEINRSEQWSSLASEFLRKNGFQPKRISLLLQVFGKMRILEIPLSPLSNEAREDFWSALAKNDTLEVVYLETILSSGKHLAALIRNNKSIFKLEIEGPVFFGEQDVNEIVAALSVNNTLFSLSMNCHDESLEINRCCERNFQRRMVLPLALFVLILLYGADPTMDKNNLENQGFPSGMPRDLIIKLMMTASMEPNQSYCNKLLTWIQQNPPKGPKDEVVEKRVGCCVN